MGAVAMISGAMLTEFVKSGSRFEAAVDALFHEADDDGDGRLSMSDVGRALAALGFVRPGTSCSLFFSADEPSATTSIVNDHASLRQAMAYVSDPASSSSPSSAASSVTATAITTASATASVDTTLCYMDSQHFGPLIRDVVLAIAHALRGCPLQLLLHDSHDHSSSILAQAIHYEASQS